MTVITPSFFYTVLLPTIKTEDLKSSWQWRIFQLRQNILGLRLQMEKEKLFHPSYHNFLKQEARQLEVYLLDLANLEL